MTSSPDLIANSFSYEKKPSPHFPPHFPPTTTTHKMSSSTQTPADHHPQDATNHRSTPSSKSWILFTNTPTLRLQSGAFATKEEAKAELVKIVENINALLVNEESKQWAQYGKGRMSCKVFKPKGVEGYECVMKYQVEKEKEEGDDEMGGDWDDGNAEWLADAEEE
ncbi:hypothetical protein HBH98_141560 [Parastagonospora nodorum]|nr:hypothetical protein HBH51_140190 [Parastagonospora nodorum]KAH4050755.1 hypothetical protein HBH49_122770 [Parastagonospora nodorum]KAH4162711.1 hypothetical protein HBH43_163270 [Parastagonospora nodorum]KAH4209558.1 hypothetical protein HBI95_077290 [Parastagonospora nodorum]KAH4227028.1 hypothetical protein HBI06_107730 [Parastagonospora nodorum]